MAIENEQSHVIEAIVKLIHGLNHVYYVSKRQIELGLKNAEKYVIETLQVDVPHAPELLKQIKT